MGMMERVGNPVAAAARVNEFLTFRLGGEEYGIDILKVQEIRGYEAVTRIANAQAFIKGVVNLRGVIVPIVDLRVKFELGQARYDASRKRDVDFTTLSGMEVEPVRALPTMSSSPRSRGRARRCRIWPTSA